MLYAENRKVESCDRCYPILIYIVDAFVLGELELEEDGGVLKLDLPSSLSLPLSYSLMSTSNPNKRRRLSQVAVKDHRGDKSKQVSLERDEERNFSLVGKVERSFNLIPQSIQVNCYNFYLLPPFF